MKSITFPIDKPLMFVNTLGYSVSVIKATNPLPDTDYLRNSCKILNAVLNLQKWNEGTSGTTLLKAPTSILKSRLRTFAISLGFESLSLALAAHIPFVFHFSSCKNTYISL